MVTPCIVNAFRDDDISEKSYGPGDRSIDKSEYDSEKKLVKINPKQYFSPLSDEIWKYQIGGYQVMDKWLKDRKEKYLDLNDIKHYCKIAMALEETAATQKKIDAAYDHLEQNVLMV